MEHGFLGAHGDFLITGLIMAAPAVHFVLEGLMARRPFPASLG